MGLDLTKEGILTDLKAELSKRSAGYRSQFNYRRVKEFVSEDETLITEILRTVDLSVFTLEEAAQAIAFFTALHTKTLSDPLPEQVNKSLWLVGTLEDAAKAVCDALEV